MREIQSWTSNELTQYVIFSCCYRFLSRTLPFENHNFNTICNNKGKSWPADNPRECLDYIAVYKIWRCAPSGTCRERLGAVQTVRRRACRDASLRSSEHSRLRPPPRLCRHCAAYTHRQADYHTALSATCHPYFNERDVPDQQRVPLLDRIWHRHNCTIGNLNIYKV